MEEKVIFSNGEYEVNGILCIPDEVIGGVVLLHGTGSDKNEAGNAYWMLADRLARTYHIASIRIDFAGYGESSVDMLKFDYQHAIKDALSAKEYLLKRIGDALPCAILGWSQGGTDAMLASETFQAVALWAGATDLKSMLNEMIQRDGYMELPLDFRSPVHFSKQWVDDVMHVDVLKQFSQYQGPVLAIAGEKDDVVPSSVAYDIIRVSRHDKSCVHVIDGMDHTFNVFTEKDYHSLAKAIDLTGTFLEDVFTSH